LFIFRKSFSRLFIFAENLSRDVFVKLGEMDFESFVSRLVNHFVNELINKGMRKKKIRRGFSDSTKSQILALQNNRCNHCNRILDVRNFDHIDNNRSNNLFFNCQALCPNCHAKKTRAK